MNAILLVSHGSRSPQIKQEILALVRQLKKKSGTPIVEAAFLQIGSPHVSKGIERCLKKGATHVIVLLNFLHSGKHATDDIPKIIEQARRKHPKVTFRVTKPLGQTEHLPELFLKMVYE